MTHFESSTLPTSSKKEALYSTLEDFRKMEQLFPKDKVKNWETDGESCRFTVDGLGDLGLIISKKEPFSLVQYTGHGKVPFNFHIQIQLLNTDSDQVKVMADAQLNPMIKMIASKPIQKFLDTLCEAIARVNL